MNPQRSNISLTVEVFDPRTTDGGDVKKILMPARFDGIRREHDRLLQSFLETCSAGLGKRRGNACGVYPWNVATTCGHTSSGVRTILLNAVTGP